MMEEAKEEDHHRIREKDTGDRENRIFGNKKEKGNKKMQ
jgi:hypothetical protein